MLAAQETRLAERVPPYDAIQLVSTDTECRCCPHHIALRLFKCLLGSLGSRNGGGESTTWRKYGGALMLGRSSDRATLLRKRTTNGGQDIAGTLRHRVPEHKLHLRNVGHVLMSHQLIEQQRMDNGNGNAGIGRSTGVLIYLLGLAL